MSALLLTLLLVPAIQDTGATVTGIVRDETTGQPLRYAVVTLPDLRRTILTDAVGRYRLGQVPPGPQHISIRLLGYASRHLHALVPSSGTLELNVSLRSEPHRLPGIDVRPPVRMRGLEADAGAMQPDRMTSLAAIGNHPLLAEPDGLLGLSGGDVVLDPEAPDGVHIRGGGSDQTGYLIDGIPVFSPYHAAGLFTAWNPDALDRVELWSAAPSPAFPDMLSGTIAGVTREPGGQLRLSGSASTTQARVTVDGPLGKSGFLLSLRQGFPALLAPGEDASYLAGESGDWLLTLRSGLLGGTVRFLGYGSDNEVTAASLAGSEAGPSAVPRHSFEWRGLSLGVRWERPLAGRWRAEVTGWRAEGTAAATWVPEGGGIGLGSARRDYGLTAGLTHRSGSSVSLFGVRGQWSRTSYEVSGLSPGGLDAAGAEPDATLFGQQTVGAGTALALTASSTLGTRAGIVRVAPRVQARWSPDSRLSLNAAVGRSHQFAQSLRNPESLVSSVFPADLYLGAGAGGLPVARSDLAVAGADYRPAAGFRAGVQAYIRRFRGLALIAPTEGGPFATRAIPEGKGRSRGAAVEIAWNSARAALLGSYGFQVVRYDPGGFSFTPDHGATHLAEGGVVVFPDPTLSIRLGAAGLWGRRGTPVRGGLEWESCNLLDRGCEFSGAPAADSSALGSRLPDYLRIDLGVRKHWHFRLARRDASIALFTTLTNLLGRRNLFARGLDPALGTEFELEMRPRAPLLVGLDWKF